MPVCSVLILTFEAFRIHNLAMHWLTYLRFGREVDSDKVVCVGIHAKTVAVLDKIGKYMIALR
jgi:hypothetical protein